MRKILLILILGILFLGGVSAGIHTIEIAAAESTGIIINYDFKQGWNLVSFPVILEDNLIENVFSGVMNKIIIITSFENPAGAKTYDPSLPMFSDLQTINEKSGYWIKVSEDVNLSLTGEEVSDKKILLGEGWNLISYLKNTDEAVVDVFSVIMNKVIIITSFENPAGAKTYDPLLPIFSDLLTMKQKLGYWVKVNESVELEY